MSADTLRKMDEETAGRAELLAMLEAIKNEHPELDSILQSFQIDHAEYDRVMLSILSAELEPQSTNATAG